MNPHQTEINRAQINKENAQFSTGPKTEEGKQKSSLNALRHGLTGQIVVMPSEDLAAYQEHLKAYTAEYHPEGKTEADLLQALADCSWRLNRVAVLETNLLSLGVTHASPITDAPSQVQQAFSIAAALQSQSKALSNLSLHSQRLSRQYEKTLHELRDLQKLRRSQQESQLDDYLDITEMFEAKGETYDPSKDGFVFTEDQIHHAIRRRTRENLRVEAHNYEEAA
jgi:hypothetical protein